jgi:LysR family transcriptional regulator for bpeEF and oprC
VSVDVDAHMLINDGESVIQAAIAGLGIIQAPHCLAASALQKGALEIIMTDTISTGSNLWIVYPQKRHLSARVQAFIEWTSELFQRTSTPQCKILEQQQAELARLRQVSMAEPASIAAVA